MRKMFFLCFTIILLFSCRKQVDAMYDDIDSVPVMNSMVIGDQVVRVNVSYAAKPGGKQLQGAENGIVELWENGEFKELLEYVEGGWFRSETIAKQGNQYKLRWFYSEPFFIEGETLIPKASELSAINHLSIAGKDEEGLTYPSVSLTLVNSPDEELYFEVRIRLIGYSSESLAQLKEIVDPVLLNEGLPLLLFSNSQMLTDHYDMTINYTTGSYGGEGSGGGWVTRLYPLIIELRSVSKDYYLFSRQKYLYDKGRFPEFGLGANVALPLYNNIIGGYGIVAGYSAVLSDTIFPTY